MGIFKDRRESGNIHKQLEQVKTPGVFVRRRDPVIGFDPAQPSTEQTITSIRPSTLASLEQSQAAVNVHVQRLKDIKTVDKKIEYKKTALLDIKEFVMSYFNSGHNYPNSVAVMFFIWSMDCGDVDVAIPLGLNLIEQKQVLPSNFKSSFPVFLCDKVYDWASEKLGRNESASPYLESVMETLIRDEWELYEPVGSKMFAMAAKHADLRGDATKTFYYGTQALDMNKKAGVKKLVDKAHGILAQQGKEAFEETFNREYVIDNTDTPNTVDTNDDDLE